MTGHGKKNREYPERWKYGADRFLKDANIVFLRQRAQSNYRGEPFRLTFEEWLAVWDGQLSRRGRGTHDLCMQRKDADGAWSRDNVEIVTRKAQLQRKVATQERPLRNPGQNYVQRKYMGEKDE